MSKWQLGVNGGVFIYKGDLTPSIVGSYKTAAPFFEINISRVINPTFAWRANFALGQLIGRCSIQ